MHLNMNNTHAHRRGEYYRVELSTNNGSAAIWLGVTNRVVQSGTTNTVTGSVFVAKTPEVFSHDADGNLTNDGHWAYVWDAENRLTRLVAPSAIPTGARYALNFTNDWRGRRTSKVVSNWTGSAWSKSYEHKFVYDGWNLVATLDSANTLLYSFQWGTDLSGSTQGAGGVGGLVSMTVHSGASAGTYFYAYDGNGNVAALINAADGTIAARYEYGPFGELIRATGPLAFLNPFRFSTKFQDDESGFLYYGYRYYDPSVGRWPNRDPLGELGGNNLYGFVVNNPLRFVDPDGRASREYPPLDGDGKIPKPRPPGSKKVFQSVFYTGNSRCQERWVITCWVTPPSDPPDKVLIHPKNQQDFSTCMEGARDIWNGAFPSLVEKYNEGQAKLACDRAQECYKRFW